MWSRRVGVGVAVPMLLLGNGFGGTATAEPNSGLDQAVISARAVSACGPLRYDPRAARVADTVNQSTSGYVNHVADNVPADETHPTAVAKDLGITGGTVISLQGASRDYGDSIRGVLLEGRNAIPDCSYTDFGTSVINDESGYILTVVILVGP
ncbi:hypothetical protein ACQ856_27045 [Mycolicibacterium psychrotolerans]|uniref:hypothetical protein n=1 Tax=Mycolicibacterium psychrotolerans TaxID=216929 RepID=UPI003D67DBF0